MMSICSKYHLCSLLCIVLLLLIAPEVNAWEYHSYGSTTEQSVQMRVSVDLSKSWKNGLSLSLSEDVRVDLYNQLSGVNAKSELVDATHDLAFSKS